MNTHTHTNIIIPAAGKSPIPDSFSLVKIQPVRNSSFPTRPLNPDTRLTLHVKRAHGGQTTPPSL